MIKIWSLLLFFAVMPYENGLIISNGNTIKQRFKLFKDYQRINGSSGSFAEYLQQQKLKPNGSKVLLYNGTTKDSEVHEAVLTTDVGKRDLQQCADAVMRLRAEYLFSKRAYGKIHFNFTNGFNASYIKWANGFRIKVDGDKVSWYKTKDSSYSYSNFRKYMDVVFTYAGTLSLAKELKHVEFSDMKIGDILIYGGSPGHAVIVVDMAKNVKGKKMFMIAQSYMPAQDIHVLKNLNNSSISPWYAMSEIKEEIHTPEWTFTKAQLKRFID